MRIARTVSVGHEVGCRTWHIEGRPIILDKAPNEWLDVHGQRNYIFSPECWWDVARGEVLNGKVEVYLRTLLKRRQEYWLMAKRHHP